jgi:MarR family transcriptional regulator, organic hydroperoxide resistance regulator
MSDSPEHASERWRLEKLLGSDLRHLTADSESIVRVFAAQNNMSTNDFRGLVAVIVADVEGRSLSAGDLRRKMGLSGGAITYLIERLTEAGHLRREADPTDRRKVILRCARHGGDLVRTFRREMASPSHSGLQSCTDSDLEAAHRAFKALVNGMRTFRTDISGPGPVASP